MRRSMFLLSYGNDRRQNVNYLTFAPELVIDFFSYLYYNIIRYKCQLTFNCINNKEFP